MALDKTGYQTSLEAAYTAQKSVLQADLTTVFSDVSGDSAAVKAQKVADAVHKFVKNAQASVSSAGDTFVKSGTVNTTVNVGAHSPGGPASGTGTGSVT